MKRRRAKLTKALQGERDVLTTGERTILKKKERNMLMTDMAELSKKARTGGACGQMEKGAVTTTGRRTVLTTDGGAVLTKRHGT